MHLREKRLLQALSRHLHEAEVGNGQDVRAGLVALDRGAHRAQHRLLVLARLHVDEVDHDEPADVAQAQLARDLLDGLEVHFEDGVLLRALALVAAGVDVDGDERLGLVDDEVGAGLHVDAAAERVAELLLDAVAVHDRGVALVELDDVAGLARDFGGLGAEALVDLGVVDDDAVDVLAHPVADDAHDEVGLLVDAAGGGLLGLGLLEVVVGGAEDAEVAHEGALRGAGAGGADDDAAVGREREAVDDALEALALVGVADLARDAAEGASGHEDEVAAGDGERGGDAGALGGDGALGDLDGDDGAGREAGGDLLVGEALGAGLAVAARGGGGALVLVVEARLVVGVHVPVVEEGVLAETDVHEGGLEVVFEVLDAALVDGADEALLGGVFDLEVLEAAVFEDGDAGFEGLGVDDDFALDGRRGGAGEDALNEVLERHVGWGSYGVELISGGRLRSATPCTRPSMAIVEMVKVPP